MIALLRKGAVGLAVALVVLVTVGGGVARADGELEVVVPQGAPLFNLDALAPGMHGVDQLEIRNHAADAGRVSVRAVDVIEDDNGCNGPETKAGDKTCGIGGGDLGHAVQFTVTAEGSSSVLFTGTVHDLEQGFELPDALGGGQAVDLDVAYVFDRASGNETQTDRLGFQIQVAMSEDGSDVVEGETIGHTATATIVGSALPQTGADIGAELRVGGALVLAGLAATSYARRRRA